MWISDYGLSYWKNVSKWIEVDMDPGSDDDIQKFKEKYIMLNHKKN